MQGQGKHFVWPLFVLMLGHAGLEARAQALLSDGESVEYALLVDGRDVGWPDVLEGTAEDHVSMTIAALRSDGYYFAEVDSVVPSGGGRAYYVSQGPYFVLGEIEIRGMNAFSADDLIARMHVRRGAPLDPQVLEEDVEALLIHYERTGYPLASVQVSRIDLQEGHEGRLFLGLQISEGPEAVLRGVRVNDGSRARPQYVARLTGLRAGRPLREFRPDELRKRLEETGLFVEVSDPEIVIEADSGAVVAFEMRDHPPGTFDLALGLLPPSGTGGGMSVVGSGHLALTNLFGSGRAGSLQLNRLPDHVSTLQVELSDPFLLGTPFSVAVSFAGLQQDSTYSKHRYAAELGLQIARGLLGFVTFSREVTEPGAAGALTGRGAVSAGKAWFGGVGIRAGRVDNRWIPRRGYTAELAVETGRKTLSPRSSREEDEAAGVTTVDQERLRSSFRVYVPVRARQVLLAGADAAAVLSPVYDESDLIRYGGATTLRGYDEDRFRARTAARALVEYRLILDRQSFAFAFTDLGYVASPALPGAESIRRGYPGYGVGMRVGTNVGLITATYAVSPEAGLLNGRVHVGLSFGL